MNGYSHTIVVGGTGMLRAASVELAKRSGALTSVARTERSLAWIKRSKISTVAIGSSVWTTTISWSFDARSPTRSKRKVRRTSYWCGFTMSRVRCSRRSSSRSRDRALPARSCMSGAARALIPPGAEDASAGRYSNLESVAYQLVVLGFHLEPETNASSWLTNDEISAGVLEAIDGGSSRVVVGQTRPWDLRP